MGKELTALAVKKLKHPGDRKGSVLTAVGGATGLYIQISRGGGKSWVLKTTINGKRRELGLGSYPELDLSRARDKAREFRAKAMDGIDPVREKKRVERTFSDAVEEYLPIKTAGYKNKKHSDQWAATLRTYAYPVLGDMRLSDIEVDDLLKVLEPIWVTKTETAMRLRGRIEAVLSWAAVKGYRPKGHNPASWKGNLQELLPAVKRRKTHQPALQFGDAQRWFSELRTRAGIGSRALEFLALTAARSGEVRGARWDEIEGDNWIIPAARMKMDREHRVPLPTEAAELLERLPRIADLIFPSPRGGQMSDMTLRAAMKRMHEADDTGYVDRVSGRPAVPHGLRSLFRDWCAEQGVDRDLAEISLAHNVGNTVERAYRRSDMLERRREVMDRWAKFLLDGS